MASLKPMQAVLDRAAYINLIGVADPDRPNETIPHQRSGRGIAGVKVRTLGKRFAVDLEPPSTGGLRAGNRVGEDVVRLDFDWLLISQGADVASGGRLRPIRFDRARSQRFAMRDVSFRFRGHTFTCYGVGRTLPERGRKAVDITATGPIIDGDGQFGDAVGVFLLSGTFTPPAAFHLHILVRINDPAGRFDGRVAPLHPEPQFDLDTTYIHVLTRALPEATRLKMSPQGPVGVIADEDMFRYQTDFAVRGSKKLTAGVEHFERIGKHTVDLDFLPPPRANPGSLKAPLPFRSVETFSFVDKQGKEVGTITAPVLEGISFFTGLPGIPPQAGLQYIGAIGHITGATGACAGMEGIVNNIGVGTFEPHLTSLAYVMAIRDPRGKLRRRR